jgi:polyribonucleotide nucleotidyltransferase
LQTKYDTSYKTYEMELAGRTLSVDIGRVGKQANGCAFMHYGDTTLLVHGYGFQSRGKASTSSRFPWI